MCGIEKNLLLGGYIAQLNKIPKHATDSERIFDAASLSARR